MCINISFDLLAQVGNPAKNILWPMELVKLKKQPCPRSKELTGQQTAKMIRLACGFW